VCRLYIEQIHYQHVTRFYGLYYKSDDESEVATQAQWDNAHDKPLSVECDTNNGQALYKVKSRFAGKVAHIITEILFYQ